MVGGRALIFLAMTHQSVLITQITIVGHGFGLSRHEKKHFSWRETEILWRDTEKLWRVIMYSYSYSATIFSKNGSF
jgi:hypothetical protein